jgi:hypothetical protein
MRQSKNTLVITGTLRRQTAGKPAAETGKPDREAADWHGTHVRGREIAADRSAGVGRGYVGRQMRLIASSERFSFRAALIARSDSPEAWRILMRSHMACC